MDLAENRLILLGNACVERIAVWVQARYASIRMLSLPRESGPTPLVHASIAPFNAVATMINTGGRTTEFA